MNTEREILNNPIFRICWTLFIAALLLGVPMVAGIIASTLDYSAVDPDGTFAWIIVHHLVQAIIFLVIIVGLRRITPLGFGLTRGNEQVGKQYVRRFTLVFSLCTIVSLAIMLLTKSFQPFHHPLTARNIIGYLGFQLFLSGPSEELIFRAFAMTMLGLVLRGRILSGKVSVVNIAAAVIFGLAHVSFSFAPFQVSYSPMQVLFCIGLGILDGDCYEKSGSVVYPMLMHSISNVITVSATILVTLLV